MISSRHSNLNFAHHFVIYWLFQNGANKNQHLDSYQRETIPDKLVFFSKIGRAKKKKKFIGWAKYMYVSEVRAEGIFVTFPWWLKNTKSGSKIALFSNERHFEIGFSKKKTITFFWSKLSKQLTKDPILHVTIAFSLKQGETRTNSVHIPHRFRGYCTSDLKSACFVCYLKIINTFRKLMHTF